MGKKIAPAFKRIVLPKRRSDAEREQDRKEGLGFVDTAWESPDYVHSYSDTVKRLAGAADAERFLLDQLALPIMYLIRHATELVLKALLSDAIAVSRMRRRLKTGKHVEPTWAMQRALDSSHNLKKLLRHLKVALQGIGFDEGLGPSLEQLVMQLAAIEAQNETAFRYPHRRVEGRDVASFTSAKKLPVLSLAVSLGTCVAEHVAHQWESPEDLEGTLQGKLWIESNRLDQLDANMSLHEEDQAARKEALASTAVEFDRWLTLEMDGAPETQRAVLSRCQDQLRSIYASEAPPH